MRQISLRIISLGLAFVAILSHAADIYVNDTSKAQQRLAVARHLPA